MTSGLEHVGIAVTKIDAVLPIYEHLLGLKLKSVKEAKQNRVKAAILIAGDTEIELLEPLDSDSPVAKFLEKRGQGIHHLAFRVKDIVQTLDYLKKEGVVLIDQEPRVGIEGGKVAFLHPKSTADVLIELCER